MQEILLKIGYFEREFLNVNFIFFSNPVPFNRESYEKQKGPGTSDLLLFRFQNKFTKISLLVIHDLTKFDGVI